MKPGVHTTIWTTFVFQMKVDSKLKDKKDAKSWRMRLPITIVRVEVRKNMFLPIFLDWHTDHCLHHVYIRKQLLWKLFRVLSSFCHCGLQWTTPGSRCLDQGQNEKMLCDTTEKHSSDEYTELWRNQSTVREMSPVSSQTRVKWASFLKISTIYTNAPW